MCPRATLSIAAGSVRLIPKTDCLPQIAAAMGLFNASGPLVHALGYTVIPIMALVGLGLSSLLGIGLLGRRESPMPTTEG